MNTAVWKAYLKAIPQYYPLILLGMALGVIWIVLSIRWTRRSLPTANWTKWLEAVLTALIVSAGLTLVYRRLACFDDAFISLRYSWNFAHGNGLVFNLGDRVEGYTNFLWTLLIGVVMWSTDLEGPFVALVVCLLTYAANVVAVHLIARRAASLESGQFHLPMATILTAVQFTFVVYGSSGLETGFATLLLNLGCLALLGQPTVRSRLIAGSFLILSVLTRLDHAIFYGAGGLVCLVDAFRGDNGRLSRALPGKKALVPLFAYAAPTIVLIVYLIWKVSYYGELLPNTYYAKSAGETRFGQGFVYIAGFLTSSHLLWCIPAALVWMFAAKKSTVEWRLAQFAAVSFPLYTFYVAKVGGDFMHGRFFVCLIPLGYVILERAAYATVRRALRSAPPTVNEGRLTVWKLLFLALAVVPIWATLGGVNFYKRQQIIKGITEESDYYSVTSLFPVTLNHHSFKDAKALEKLREHGVRPRLATYGVGMVSYYSRLYVLDLAGLTDYHVARTPLKKRGRPGHERWASKKYIRTLDIDLMRGGSGPSWFGRRDEFTMYRRQGRKWRLETYDAKLLEKVREVAPEMRFANFEQYLARYVRSAERKSFKTLKRDYRFFKYFYFDRNEDAERQKALREILARKKAKRR